MNAAPNVVNETVRNDLQLEANQQQIIEEQKNGDAAGIVNHPANIDDNSSVHNSREEEKKEHADADDDQEGQLGSELSGISEDVPDEVTDITRSANYLTSYARDYKSDVLKSKKSKVKFVFKDNGGDEQQPKEKLIKPIEDRQAAQ